MKRWRHIPRGQREHSKLQAEELQKQYKVDLEQWLESLSPEEYTAYRERTYGKRKNMNMRGVPDPKIIRTDVQSPPAGTLPGGLAQEWGLQAPGTASSETSQGSEDNKEDGGKAEGSVSSDFSSEDADVECEDRNSSL